MKSLRQEKILEIISTREIETQNQLMEALQQEGVKSTQATLSRDIRDLHLTKEMGPSGTYRYVAGNRDGVSDFDMRLKKILRESVVDYATAQNIVVIKTLPGLANAAAAAFDGMSIHNLVGTLAGDDTVFLAMKDTASSEHFVREIENLL